MVQQNPGEHRPAVSRVRKVIALNERAIEGDNPGFVETIETTEITNEGLQETSITKYTYCGGCGKPIRSAEELGARCMGGCRTLLCKDCSSTVCADEGCSKTICPSCRVKWNDTFYCKEHARVHATMSLGAFFIIFIIIVLGLYLLWTR